MKKIVLSAEINCEKCRREAYEAISNVDGVESATVNIKEKKVTIIGDVDPAHLTMQLRRVGWVELLSVGPHVQENKKVIMMEDKRDSKEVKNGSKQDDKSPSLKQDVKDSKNSKYGSTKEAKNSSPNQDKTNSKEGKSILKKEDKKSFPQEEIKVSKEGKYSPKKEDKKSSLKEVKKDTKDGKHVSQNEGNKDSKEGKNGSKKEVKKDVTNKVQTQNLECRNMSQEKDINIYMQEIPEECISHTHTFVVGGSYNHYEDMYVLSDENPNACSIC